MSRRLPDDTGSLWNDWSWPMRIIVILSVIAWFTPAIISIIMILGGRP